MDLRGRKLKFAAITALVVLSLTGFSSGRGHGGGSGDGDSGGGCSSSSQDHDSSSSRYDDDDDASSGGSSSGSGGASAEQPQDAMVRLVSCATEQEPYATLEVANPNTSGATFTITVDFLDASKNIVETRTVDEFVAGSETATVQVELSNGGLAAKVAECASESFATAQ
ncbi:hypothetical protein [Streptomyces sp. NPDC003635]